MGTAARRYRTIAPHAVFVLIAIISAYFLLQGATGDAAIMDELAHIPAGYGYARYLDYRLNPEHPPLVKVLAALPLLAEPLSFPAGSPAWQQEVNGQWNVGRQFLYESGNDADRVIFLSRLFPVLLTLLTLFFVYLWGRELLGRWWALLPTALFAFSPTVLAHGHYVTTDVAAAFGVLIAIYAFVRWLLQPAPRRLMLAGIAFGAAQLMEFSALLLAPAFVLLALIFFWGEARRRGVHRLRGTALAGSLLLIFAIGGAVTYAGYFAATLHYPAAKQAADISSILSSTPALARDVLMRMAWNPVLRPLAEYVLGIVMTFQRSSGEGTYFLGEVSSAGRWYYSPAAFLLKEPLPALLLVISALGLWVKKVLGKAQGGLRVRLKIFADYLGTHFAEFSMLTFVVLYAAFNVNSPLPIGVRHMLPVLPFLYLLAAGGLKSWAQRGRAAASSCTEEGAPPRKARWRTVVVAALVLWQAAEAALAAPFFLSYFNPLGGGVTSGYRYATDSNYDWGQDLKRLKVWTEERNRDDDYDNDIQKIAVDYFGGGDPRFYMGETAEGWWSARGNPKDIGIEWLAVSVSVLQGAMQPLVPPLTRTPEDEYRWLRELRLPAQAGPPEPGLGGLPTPDFRAGTSIFIYHL